MTNQDKDQWLSGRVDHGFQRTHERKRSIWSRLLWRSFWMLAMMGIIAFAYLKIGEQAKALIQQTPEGNQTQIAPISPKTDVRIVREQLGLAENKKLAWERSFKPSEICRNNPNTVECANAYIRARRAFDENYKD